MTTLKDYKEKVLKEFREKFIRSIKSQGEYCHFFGEDTGDIDNVSIDGTIDFDFVIEDLSLAIDNAVAEAFKAVEVERMDDTPTGGFTSSVITVSNAVGHNFALQEVEDRKKQYLV